MVFNSLTFVVFFACVLALHSLPLPWTTKKINLAVASYLFYAAWNPPFVILLWISTVVDWYAAQGLVNARRQAARHAWMLLSVIANLGMLGYFKYGQFMLDNFTALMGALGISYHPAHYDIVLPVGISFYTFATMSYTLDVYLRRAAPAQNLLDYALFVTFFPHLVAGPIMRPTELVPQFAQPRRASAEQLRFGLALMTIGLFNKIVLADSFLSRVAERSTTRQIPGAGCVGGDAGVQWPDCCDFAGYSTTAIGAALPWFTMPDSRTMPPSGWTSGAAAHHAFSWLRDIPPHTTRRHRHGARRLPRAHGRIAARRTVARCNWTVAGADSRHLSFSRADARALPTSAGTGGVRAARASPYALNPTWVFFRAKTPGRAGSSCADRTERRHAANPADFRSR
jgi:alginate O-acetyltransferase complex protein AlgI